MKKNITTYKTGLVGISLALLLASGLMSCTQSGAKKEDNPTALLYLVNNPIATENQQICFVAYSAANSCVGGKEYFNAGPGCAETKIGTKTKAELSAFKECVFAKVNDPIQPCNLPQFTYGLASQALAGVFAACNKSYTTTAGATVDLTGYLVY